MLAMLEEDARVSDCRPDTVALRNLIEKRAYDFQHLSKTSARWVPHMLTQEQKDV